MPSTTERTSRVAEARDLLEQTHDLLGIECNDAETVISSIALRLVEHLDDPDQALLDAAWDLLIREDRRGFELHKQMMLQLARVTDLVCLLANEDTSSPEREFELVDRFAELTTSVEALTAKARLVRQLA